jgi:hypothetical protein
MDGFHGAPQTTENAMKRMRNAYRIVLRKYEWKSPLARSRNKWRKRKNKYVLKEEDGTR